MRTIKLILTQLLLLLYLCSYGQRDAQPKQESVFSTNVPAHNYDIILGRPTQSTISLSILSYLPAQAFVEYWSNNKQKMKTATMKLNQNEPFELELNNLIPNQHYSYQLHYKSAEQSTFSLSQCFNFQTQRAKTNSFSFSITADSHLDQNTDTATYKKTLNRIAADSSDFHIDLGDTFMTDKYRSNYKDAFNQYIAQRYYFGCIGASSPLFLILGNHDGESGQRLNGREDNMTVWSTLNRKKYYPNPAPNSFYSGNMDQETFVGSPQNYYSWVWGDALFVVLDPFRYSPRASADEPWERTLGKTQYDWLKKVLEKSDAKFKFVFIHNLVGGVDKKGKARGGVEAVPYFEWGGKNSDGTEGFSTHRPDWEMPIHILFVKQNVTAVFHGHDHLFAQQNLDGIVYQCLSQPGGMDSDHAPQAEEYGYIQAKILNKAGYMRVRVNSEKAIFDFIGTNSSSAKNNPIYSYEIKSKTP